MRHLMLIVCVALSACVVAEEPMERPGDVEAVWEGQQEEVTPAIGAHPEFSGMMVWSGRADRNYKPFFQWELRLKAGVDELKAVRLRIQPLAPDLTPLQKGRIGAWKSLGTIPAGEEADLSYKFNTPIFSAYRVEVTWHGGKAAYLATDRQMLPLKEGALDGVSQLVAIEPIWDRSPKGQAAVRFWLRNTGGADAKQVKLTLSLRDGTGKVVMEHPYIPNDGVIPAGYAEEQKVLIQKTPSFSTIQIRISKAEESSFALENVDYSGGNIVEVGGVHEKDGALLGGLRNGTKDQLRDIVVTLYFTDDTGSTLAERTVKIDELKPGATKDWRINLADIPAWTGYETDLAYGILDDGNVSNDQTAQAVSQPQVIVEGLALTILEHSGAAGVLKIKAELHNQTAADMPGLDLTLEIAGAQAPIEMHVGDLAKDERLTLTLMAEGTETLSGLRMNWKSKAP